MANVKSAVLNCIAIWGLVEQVLFQIIPTDSADSWDVRFVFSDGTDLVDTILPSKGSVTADGEAFLTLEKIGKLNIVKDKTVGLKPDLAYKFKLVEPAHLIMRGENEKWTNSLDISSFKNKDIELTSKNFN